MQSIQHRVFSIVRSSAVLTLALLVTSCISSGVTGTDSSAVGNGTLGQSSGATDADGTAAITYTAATMVGTSTVTATITGLPPVVFNVTVNPSMAMAINPARTSP
jgi:hypothetical protein